MPDNILTLLQTSSYLNISKESARRLFSSGEIRAFKIGTLGKRTDWRVRQSELDAYVRKSEEVTQSVIREERGEYTSDHAITE